LKISMRLAVSLVTAALVFVLAYLSAWVSRAGAPIAMGNDYALISMRTHFLVIQKAISDYAAENGHYPTSLDELARGNINGLQLDESGKIAIYDAWGNPWQYERTGEGYRLYSLGRDGQPGGVGLDADIEPDSRGSFCIELTLGQFLFEARGAGKLFIAAFVASLFAGLGCYLTGTPGTKWLPGRITLVLLQIGVMTVIALFVSFFLTVLYLIGDHH
jgi:hypothetical protein